MHIICRALSRALQQPKYYSPLPLLRVGHPRAFGFVLHNSLVARRCGLLAARSTVFYIWCDRMNLPNLLTILRIFFVPLLVAVVVQERLQFEVFGVAVAGDLVALAIFLTAAATDLLDGYLARRWGQVTTVGTLLDPIADKLLISAALIALVQIRLVPAWMVILIVGREFAISGLRGIAAAEGYTIKSSELGKTKMTTQVIAVVLLLMSMRFPGLSRWAMLWMWGVLLFTLVSAADYFRKFWRKVDTRIKLRRRRELLLLERRQRRRERAAAAKQRAAGAGVPEPPAGL
jgi:CDP-diacylglycerol--glycerol-3-phosphate 3-phosphatidyltransferase